MKKKWSLEVKSTTGWSQPAIPPHRVCHLFRAGPTWSASLNTGWTVFPGFWEHRTSKQLYICKGHPGSPVCHTSSLIALKCVLFPHGCLRDESAPRSSPLNKLHIPSKGCTLCQPKQRAVMGRHVPQPKTVSLAGMSQLCRKWVGYRARPDWGGPERPDATILWSW
jgi:hypothetical protein